MPIVFSNPGLLDIRAVETMGLSAKETDHPIGFFGTGLKYAIATLLRTGSHIVIWVGRDKYTFSTTLEDFRGKSFQFVQMRKNNLSPTRLGFTTELGKNWEPWMALREIESNCRDENGTTTNPFAFDYDGLIDNHSTHIVLSGAIENEFNKLDSIFLNSTPLWEDNTLSIHQGSIEQRGWIYYRGVRCAQVEKPSMYVYNVKETMTLTEDRTFRYNWASVRVITRGVMGCTVEGVLENILTAGKLFFESGFDYRNCRNELPPLFISIVQRLGIACNLSAVLVVREVMGGDAFKSMDNIPAYIVQLRERAVHFIVRMGEPSIVNYEIKVSDNIGDGVLGKVFLSDRKTIWLSTRVFEMGFKQVVSTLYEEFVHLSRGYDDNTYEMQSFLFDKIIQMASRAMGEEI